MAGPGLAILRSVPLTVLVPVMAYWLLKSEPSVYGIDALVRDRRTTWDGVRNYQVRNFMRDAMQVGDLGFFYHSSCPEPGVAGTVRISGAARPDPTQFDRRSEYYDPKSRRDAPAWLTVEVALVRRYPVVISLAQLRATKSLADLAILRRGNRLSITPVTAAEWRAIEALAG
jgi:predicted RNA-binding protein with PUA-like domain